MIVLLLILILLVLLPSGFWNGFWNILAVVFSIGLFAWLCSFVLPEGAASVAGLLIFLALLAKSKGWRLPNGAVASAQASLRSFKSYREILASRPLAGEVPSGTQISDVMSVIQDRSFWIMGRGFWIIVAVLACFILILAGQLSQDASPPVVAKAQVERPPVQRQQPSSHDDRDSDCYGFLAGVGSMTGESMSVLDQAQFCAGERSRK